MLCSFAQKHCVITLVSSFSKEFVNTRLPGYMQFSLRAKKNIREQLTSPVIVINDILMVQHNLSHKASIQNVDNSTH